ncbi:MAG: zinc ABC transporter substrate-binding protein [Muribaculaceae bacterium]|nr:zinc ABC transporter substrate-binding protein [Muribaculaceae bacterium]
MVGCRHESTPGRTITVSIEPQRWLLEQIAGNRFEVRSLLGRGANPESYDPTFNDLADMERSRAYLTVGNLAFEDAITAKLKENNPDLKIFCTSDSITLLHATHGDHDHGADPHVWSSPRNMKQMAGNMLSALCSLDPDNAAEYESNFRRLNLRIDSVDAACDSILTPVKGTTFIVWHPSLSYFARDYNIHQLALGSEGKEHSVGNTVDLLNRMKESGARVFLIQKDFDASQAKALSGEVKTVTIDPMNYDWDKEMLHTARSIAAD